MERARICNEMRHVRSEVPCRRLRQWVRLALSRKSRNCQGRRTQWQREGMCDRSTVWLSRGMVWDGRSVMWLRGRCIPWNGRRHLGNVAVTPWSTESRTGRYHPYVRQARSKTWLSSIHERKARSSRTVLRPSHSSNRARGVVLEARDTGQR